MIFIMFNGWFSGFFDKTNPGLHVEFFLQLFEKIYGDSCQIGDVNNSNILCECDMLLDCPGSLIYYKKWKNTFLFNGESTFKQNRDLYDVVLSCERNNKNIINIPLFIPYMYTNHFENRLIHKQKRIDVPSKHICVFITNPNGIVRNTFLHVLEQIVKIDYCGNYKNNIGNVITSPYNSEEFLNFIKDYKFIISMENSQEDTYITEKIMHGLLANIVPVYWGSNRVLDYFNEKRIIHFDSFENIVPVVNNIIELINDNEKWLDVVNENNFNDNTLTRNIDDIVKDIKSLLQKMNWKNVDKIYCINNPIFEPIRHNMLKNMFSKYDIHDEDVKYISPTYKHTICQETYDNYTSNQLVRHLRSKNIMYAELSLFLNYKAVLEDIEKNYKDGMFLIFESDVIDGKEITRFNNFLEFVKDKDFDLINIGLFAQNIYDSPFLLFNTGYRKDVHEANETFLHFCKNTINNEGYIEDITNKTNEFRLVRKFHTNCTDSFLWKYSGIVKFLQYMREFTDYSSPFDYYMCHFFENNLDFKHYWSVTDFFFQGSNLNLIPSTLDR